MHHAIGAAFESLHFDNSAFLLYVRAQTLHLCESTLRCVKVHKPVHIRGFSVN